MEISIKELNITIQAVRVDGKKLTAALFKQLPAVRILDDNGEIAAGVTLLGFVRHTLDNADRWVLAAHSGVLYRYPWFADYLTAKGAESLLSEDQEELKLFDAGDADARSRVNQRAYRAGFAQGQYNHPTTMEQARAWLVSEIAEREEWVPIAHNRDATEATLQALPQLFIGA